VIYARVSTKGQQEEGFSIPAQLKAIRTFCAKEGFEPITEFVEAQSAGKSGRKQFGAMLDFLREHPEVRLVVAHKLDRLYRNFADQIKLEEELGIRARYVLGDVPDSPQGELLRDVQLSVAKFYLGNLSEEVMKGMAEKAAQGGWCAGAAPIGYLNDKQTRSLVVDPLRAPLVQHAFERYATGLVSLDDLANELHSMGLRSLRSGRKVYPSSLHIMLHNPLYCGVIRYKGNVYQGQHEALISWDLYDRVQKAFEPNGTANAEQKHVFALRDFLYCDVCGCKITAEKQRGHVYYRCTHSKGRDVCDQRTYTREEKLAEQIEDVLATIEIGPEVLQSLVEESRLLDEQQGRDGSSALAALEDALAENRGKTDRLLDSYLDGIINQDTYQRKAKELGQDRIGFEQRLQALSAQSGDTRTARLEALSATAAGARIRFKHASIEERREVLATVGLNATLRNQEIVDYQLKKPFDMLQIDSNGALIHEKWAILDLNQ
jgi:DNA invertase Pin-like site-specific DNA recombinase